MTGGLAFRFFIILRSNATTSLFWELEETVQQWTTWDNVTVIQHHRMIKDHLWDLFLRYLNVRL